MPGLSGRENHHRITQTAIAYRDVTPEFISTSGMQIIEGKDFSNNTASENFNAIINESMAKLLGTESAVGKIIPVSRVILMECLQT